ncbi:MAG: AraC family transcriptional regulator [Pseudomonadota bacterium]
MVFDAPRSVAGILDPRQILSALKMQPLLGYVDAQREPIRSANFGVVTDMPGLAVATYVGETAGGVERAVFEGGTLICISLSGLDASRIGTYDIAIAPAGRAVALSARDPIQVASIARSARHREIVSVFVSNETLDRLQVKISQSASSRREVVHQWPVTETVRALARDLLRPTASGWSRQLRGEALALEMLAQLHEAEAGGRPDRAPRHGALAAARRVRDIIHSNPAANHCLASLAGAVGISPAALKRDFRDAFGTSPIAFLRAERLSVAREMIEHQGCSVASAAYACGYDHPGNFSQAFRRHFGVAPSSLLR